MAIPRLRPYPQNGAITIANGVEHPIEKGGNFIRVRQSDQTFTILLDDDVELKAEQNDVFQLTDDDEFKSLAVINDSGANLTFQLEIGYGEVKTNNVSISGTLKAALQGHSTLSSAADDSIAATSTELVLASNTNRKEALITNLSSNAGNIRVGDSNAGASRGVEVSPGQTVTLSTTAAIYVYNEGTSAQSVGLLEVE